jgi:hypothetical protein
MRDTSAPDCGKDRATLDAFREFSGVSRESNQMLSGR